MFSHQKYLSKILQYSIPNAAAVPVAIMAGIIIIAGFWEL